MHHLQLFSYTPIPDPNPEPLYSDNVTSVCATPSHLIIAHTCTLRLAEPTTLTPIKTVLAYDTDYTISTVHEVPQTNLIVTVGEKQGAPTLVRVWDTAKLDDEDSRYRFHSQSAVVNGDNSYPVSSFAFTADLSCIAVGYANGKVVLVRGDMLRDRGTKQRVVYESADPVTGLHFNTSADIVYVCTTSRILTVQTNGRNQGRPSRILAKTGVDLYCSAVDPGSQNLVVATDDGIVFYSPEALVQQLDLKCPKNRIFRAWGNYLCMVSSANTDVLDTRKRLVTRVLVVDLLNQHVAFNLMVPNAGVVHIWSMRGLCVLSTDGILYHVEEKSVKEQIDVVVDRNLFQIAYQLGVQTRQGPDVLLGIERAYGDYLYGRGDFAASLERYKRCLHLYEECKKSDKENKESDDKSDKENKESADKRDVSSLDSFIMTTITQFKDLGNISNLAEFLVRLYEMKIASNDHITLLLCCYCKMQATESLDRFIAELDVTQDFQDLNFQMIINLFKECGFLEQVLALLHKLNQPNLIAGIMLNDLLRHRECMAYIKTLQIDDLLLVLLDHSKTLLDYLPIETTELLINVFTGKYTPCEHEHERPSPPKEEISSYAAFLSFLKTEENVHNHTETGPTYSPPRPALIYPSFINHAYEFVIFLEACIDAFDKYQGALNDKKELLLTLLEMYLSLSAKSADRNKRMGKHDEWKQKAVDLIGRNVDLLDNTALLLVSHVYRFPEGEALAQEKSGYEESLFRSYQIARDYSGCWRTTQKHGDSKPHLYKLMLQFAVSDRQVFEQCSDADFRFLLGKISDLKLMAPLELLQMLTSDPEKDYLTLGLIKGYLSKHIRDQDADINNNLKLIEYYETESTKNSLKLSRLESEPLALTNNKCADCRLMLDFPLVHFRCKHSYHQKCLANSLVASPAKEKRCPRCINEVDEIESVREGFQKTRERVDLFEGGLEESKDRFRFMCDQLGRGLMGEDSIRVSNES